MARFRALFAVFLSSALASSTAWSQQHRSPASAAPTSNSNYSAKLAKPVLWGDYKVRLFKDDETTLTFTLSTSWIPGEDKKGRFRYRLDATVPQHGDGVTVTSIEKTLKRTQACSLYLVLNDKYDFRLRSIPVYLSQTVDESLNLRGLNANSAEPMDIGEYRSLVGEPGEKGGNWQIKWNCGIDQ